MIKKWGRKQGLSFKEEHPYCTRVTSFSIQYKAEQSKNDSFLLKPWFFIPFLGFSMYILCSFYILAITFFFSRLCDVKAYIFFSHELSHQDVLLDNLFTLPYKLKSNLHIQTYIIFLLFKSQIFLFITILIPINKFKCLIGFQLLTVLYLIFEHYSMLPYLFL